MACERYPASHSGSSFFCCSPARSVCSTTGSSSRSRSRPNTSCRAHPENIYDEKAHIHNHLVCRFRSPHPLRRLCRVVSSTAIHTPWHRCIRDRKLSSSAPTVSAVWPRATDRCPRPMLCSDDANRKYPKFVGFPVWPRGLLRGRQKAETARPPRLYLLSDRLLRREHTRPSFVQLISASPLHI